MNGEGVLLASGGVYHGTIQDGRPEGIGRVEWPQRPRSAASYHGELQRGVRSGRGQLVTTEDITFTGAFKDNMRHGDGVHTLNGRVRYEGHFVDGHIHGRGSCVYDNYLEYNGDFKNGVIHGEGTMRFADGATYTGSFHEGMRHGDGRMTWSDGDKYVGAYRNDLRHGLGTYTWNTGQRYHGHFMDGKRNGLGVFTWPDGATFCGNFEDDRRSGPGVLCHEDGSVDAGLWDGSQLWRLLPVQSVLNELRENDDAKLLKAIKLKRRVVEGMLTKMSKKAMEYAQRGETRMLEHSLRRCKVHQDVSNEYGVNLLMFAACNNHTDTVRMLLDFGAAINLLTVDGVSTLNLSYHVAWSRCLDLLPYSSTLRHPDTTIPSPQAMHPTYELLLERGADPDLSSFPSPVLIAAINNADVHMCQLLLASGCNPNIIDPKDASQQTPILRVARLLLQHDAHSDDDLLRRRLAIMRLLLQAGTQLNRADADGATVLHALASVSLPDASLLITEIIGQDASVDQLDDDGYTPLARAVIAGNLANIEALLSNNADPNVHVGANRDLPINLAITAHPNQDDDELRFNLVSVLLKNSADPTFSVPVVVNGGDVARGTVMDSVHIRLQTTGSRGMYSKRLSSFDPSRSLTRKKSSMMPPRHARDMALCELLTNSIRDLLLKRQSFNDIELCAQCGRSYKQRLMPFSGSAHIFFCGERCKMRALNGDHRKALLASLKSTDPNRWKFLQLADEPHLVWRGDTISEVHRAVTAPPDYHLTSPGKAVRRRKPSAIVSASDSMKQASVVSQLSPAPSLAKPLPNTRSLISMHAAKLQSGSSDTSPDRHQHEDATHAPSPKARAKSTSSPPSARKKRMVHAHTTTTLKVMAPSRAARTVERLPGPPPVHLARPSSAASSRSSRPATPSGLSPHRRKQQQQHHHQQQQQQQHQQQQQQHQQQQQQQQRHHHQQQQPRQRVMSGGGNALARSLPAGALRRSQSIPVKAMSPAAAADGWTRATPKAATATTAPATTAAATTATTAATASSVRGSSSTVANDNSGSGGNARSRSRSSVSSRRRNSGSDGDSRRASVNAAIIMTINVYTVTPINTTTAQS
ncbi:hypothetical protein PTSG_04661 [Salpingoeca rosetta]|uniref:Uncharacterized protein n=1 Tax=Salpingoeca rosetta (strain ATCC 50818 / BSB-021) TaxID=946362 RepID=F2U825_SALR5|nr:uncharacterized protein PTSG_04661 [Salpingoeca rosetta]EGD72930.1 hypothetical protein PTSG_04661 [Salpingoeca rosetta]|eukprot:XP_004994752.1 hypothetical protein PTSG_04661 [Salpingoeca rosetta]